MGGKARIGMFALLLAAAGILAAAAAAQGQPATEAARLHKLFDDDWKWVLHEFPEFATFVGHSGENHRWSDQSLGAIEKQKQYLAGSLKKLGQIDRAKLDAADQLNYDLYQRFLGDQVDGHRFPGEYLAISQLGGPQVGLAQVYAAMPSASVKDFEKRIARLNAIPTVIDQTIVLLNKGLEKKVTPSRITLRDVPQQMQNLIPDEPEKSPFFQPFAEFSESVPAADRARLAGEAKAAISGKVVPAFRKLHEYFSKTYLPRARETIGQSALPDGLAWYAYLARVSTTTNLTPQQIHDLGLAEVKRIRAEMEKVMKEAG